MVFLPDNTITGLPTDDVIIGTPDSDEIYGFEGIDVVIGAENIDLLYGNEEADLLYGSQADDTLYGGKGDDILFGGQGNDFLSGNVGNDTLYGDQGADTLTGGVGNDVIVIGRGTGGSNLLTADVMTDFDVTVDQIQLLDGLSYSDLTIESTETGGTVISESVTGEVFIILEGVAPEALTPDHFIFETSGMVDPPPPPVPPLMSPEEAFEGVELIPPVIEAQLANDTGNSNTDNITSDPTVSGTVTDSSGVLNLEASFGDEDEFVDVSDALAPDGTFTLNLTQLEEVSEGELTDGDYTLLLRSQDTVLNTSQPPTLVSFSLDTTAPDISVELANDTGDSNTDGVTTDPTVTGTITDAGEIVSLRAGFDGNLTDISDELGADGSFELNQLDLQILQGTPLVDGEISLEVEAEDEFGQVSGTTLSFTLDTTTPPPPPPGDDDGDDPSDDPGDEPGVPNVPDLPDVDIPDEDEDTPVEMVNNEDMEVTPPPTDPPVEEEVEEDPGDTPEEALNITVSSDETVYMEEVGEEDLNDFYTFTIGANSGVDISLDNIGEEVDLFLLDSNQEVIDSSQQLGLTPESITRPLEAGTYTVQVTSVNEQTTEYDLNISVTPNLPGVSTTGSDELIIGGFDTDVSSAFINLEPPVSDPTMDAFRTDPRFADIDGSGYSVVILDTGMDLDNEFFGPDSDGNGVADRVVYQFDYGNFDADASDFVGHGTGMTSIIASEDETFTGMAPGVDIIHLKISNDFGEIPIGAVEQALQWVADNVDEYNIASVNMSFTLANSIDLLNSQEEQTPASIGISDELAEIASQDVIVVSSSGNGFFDYGSNPGVSYPSSDPNALSVGAVWEEDQGGPFTLRGAIDFTTDEDRIAAFSQRDPNLTDVFAPGGVLSVASPDGEVTTTGGTSAAAAHVTGIAVLAQQLAEEELGRRLTFEEFQTLINDTGVTIFDGDFEDDNVLNTFEEYQRVDVLALAEGILALDTPPPAPPELVRYDFTYFYDGDNFDILDNDFYVGYVYDEPGAYSVNTLYDVFSFDNEADSNGLYFVSGVSEAPDNAFEDAVYVTDYYDADFSEELYTPYWSGLGFASGYGGLGSEYDFVEDLDGDFFDFGNDFYEADVFDPFFVSQLFSRTDYDANTQPGELVNADLNNDGTDELIVANTNDIDSGFSVLPNLGNGSFGFPEDYITDFFSSGDGDDPSLDVGDFDGDGNIDIVTANTETDEVSIFFGDGNGNLDGIPLTFEAGDRPVISEATDVDNDDATDIVLINSEFDTFGVGYDGDSISVLFNRTDNNVFTLEAGEGVEDVVAADLDGDGDVDLATANQVDNTLSVLYNFGNLAFSFPVTIPVGSRPLSIVADDFDGDGSTDLATANFEFGTVSVVLNNGDGSFGSADFYFANDFPSTMSSADLDADGDADLILRNSVFRDDDTQEGDSISILQNNGDGTFAFPQSFTVGDVPVGLIVEDLDGNGLLDIATSNFESQDITVYLQSLLITT